MVIELPLVCILLLAGNFSLARAFRYVRADGRWRSRSALTAIAGCFQTVISIVPLLSWARVLTVDRAIAILVILTALAICAIVWAMWFFRKDVTPEEQAEAEPMKQKMRLLIAEAQAKKTPRG